MVEAPFIEAAMEEIAGLIEAGATRIGLTLPTGVEKSAVLDRLEDTLSGRQVIRIELPDGDDAGLVALALGAAQFEAQAPGLLKQIESLDIPWRVKLQKFQAVAKNARRVVFLVDDPRFIPAMVPQEELFARRALEVTNALLEMSDVTVVLAGERIPPGVARMVAMMPSPETTAGLLVTRLLNALAAAGMAVERIPRHHRRVELLVQHDLARLALEDAALRLTLLRLSVLRVPFPAELLDRMVATSLSQESRQMLELLLSTTSDGMRVLPHALGRFIRTRHEQGVSATADPAWQANEPISDMHRLAAEHHREQFNRAKARRDVLGALRHDLEEIYHLTEAGDAVAVLSRSLWFVEQYDALGRALSKQASLVSREAPQREEALRWLAIQAYERALVHDRDDAYAHHYIAHNLDILAADPARAEREYVVARDLEPTHAWYHSRYIRFLLTTAWMTEARAAWECAFDGLGNQLGPLDYEELHGQVARLLLHRGELEFAREVLEDVPEEAQRLPWWRALMRFLVYLEEERDELLVFPPDVSMEERWVRPHLVPEAIVHRVKRWRPGRVIDRDERHVHLRVAARDADVDQVTISYIHLSRWRLKNVWSSRYHLLPAGTFVELLEYKDGSRELKAWSDRASTFRDAELPKLFPPPDRYIRRGFARS
jgi:hypothetical protein